MALRLPLADIQFISDFAVYARGKTGAYDYSDNCNCAVAQFLRDTGRAVNPWVGGWGRWRDGEGDFHDAPDGVGDALLPTVKLQHAWAGLADRLEALLVDAPVVERG